MANASSDALNGAFPLGLAGKAAVVSGTPALAAAIEASPAWQPGSRSTCCWAGTAT